MSLSHNKLVVNAALDVSDHIPNTYWTTKDSTSHSTLAEIESLVKADMQSHPDLFLGLSADAFYEKGCPDSYAKIAVQLPSKSISVGTDVQFQLFDRSYKTRVLPDLNEDGIFHYRVLSEHANGQGRQSTRGLLLTEDCWVHHDKVTISFPKPDVRLKFGLR